MENKRFKPNYSPTTQSFAVRRDSTPQHHKIWHHHEEFEFIHIRIGTGTFFIGDCIRQFDNGTTVLIGKHTPHYWHFDKQFIDQNIADVVVIHFKENFAGKEFFHLPELNAVMNLLDKSQRGIFLSEDNNFDVQSV